MTTSEIVTQWVTFGFSVAFAGVGIFLAYKTSVLLARIEEQSKAQTEKMYSLVEKQVNTQLKIFESMMLGNTIETEDDKIDVKEQLDRLRNEVRNVFEEDKN